MPDLRLGNVFQLLSRRISRRWTRSGTNLVIFLGALCAQTNLFWREMRQCADNRDTEKCQLSILSGVRIKQVNFRENI